MASKALRPLPVLHKELSEETRVRQRYADLIVRQEARDMVRTQAAIAAGRSAGPSRTQGYLEVETPCSSSSTAAPRPGRSSTHINAFDQEMTLRIALELNLKKAVVGGVDRVYEIGRIFRNEGVDATHSPEFTMLEAYQAYGDQHTIAELMRDVLLAVGRRARLAPGRDARRARSTSTASGAGCAVYEGVCEAVGETVTPETDVETLRGSCREAPRRRLRPGLGRGEARPRAARRAGRARPAPADLRLRLPRRRPAAGPAAPRRARR